VYTVCVLHCLYGVVNDDDDYTVLLYSLNPKFCKENVKNCMLISHFALASGDFVPQTPYRDFAPGPTGDFRYPDPLPPPHHVNPSIVKFWVRLCVRVRTEATQIHIDKDK